MKQQFCPQVGDFVPADKCNACNKELVGRTGYCCTYISCLETCDYREKESCPTYIQKMLERGLK